ncbi:S4 domain containing protein [Sporothrix schenckii 1099-18]|uniref:Small ribosomal subunit protein uS4m n=2 Tax=Sporothrix schenckii TaxID=29908 RepID=U7PQL9_SPOS1|nr:S4 domain containing protein [Sporothrix schenckii 1099-18]ERS97913.1 hypothetical protein HMPREF1624_06084 [Sporothrix schenckii ATCC 58251]KJR82484.1 S4 domain containing protein [Sporothrix schenckii 1099-18]
MKTRRSFRYHSLRRVRLRQNWNKYNLFNMQANYPQLPSLGRTFFQQKWAAKALTRGYHGEHIKEGKWERMFSRRLQSVTNFDPRYMARFDGSEQAAGRGRGRATDPALGKAQLDPEAGTNQVTQRTTPYMQMAFAPMERRLDIAIFRAMFASSARQARQFVVHGAVTVNGKKMIYPGYLLNPGDMFQVDVDHVLFGTGMKKSSRKARRARNLGVVGAAKEAETAAEATAEAETAPAEVAAAEGDKDSDWITEDSSGRLTLKIQEALEQTKTAKKTWPVLARLLKAAYRTPNDQSRRPPPNTPLADSLTNMLNKLEITNSHNEDPNVPQLTDNERKRFKKLLAEEAENPVDLSKPYATPWRPRPFMRAFAFIPRYLEVNQNICAAVYLRHPVCRPGYSEVPTPFPPEISQLAFNWYLRRG